MFTHRITKPLATTVVAGSLALGALATAVTASAGTSDNTFGDVLADNGITYDSPAMAAGDAKLVCSQLSAGATPSDAANQVLADTDLDSDQAVDLVAASVVSYCPQFKDVPFDSPGTPSQSKEPGPGSAQSFSPTVEQRFDTVSHARNARPSAISRSSQSAGR